jgi:hypothetical protein
MPFWVITAVAAAVLAIAAPAASARNTDASCAIQNLVVRVLAESEHFMHHLETGLYPDSATDLDRRLGAVSLVSLRRRLEDAGFSDAAGTAERMVLQQRLVLRANRVDGRAPAAAVARDMGAAATLQEIRAYAATWPCFDSSRRFSGLKAAAPGGSRGRPAVSQEMQSALFGGFGIFLAAAASYFWWRSKIDKRQTERFSCWIPCTLRDGSLLQPAFIVNLSRSGARLRGDRMFEPGQDLEVSFSGESVSARVVWSRRRHCAVHFSEALSGSAVQTALDTYG